MRPVQTCRGFGLIEVLVAVLVIGFGVVALAQLQGTFVKSAAQTSQREVALHLARAKLDDLRSFSPGSSFEFEDILSDEGGISTQLNSGAVTFKNQDFSLSWTVEDYMLDDLAAHGFSVADVGAGDTVVKKAVIVDVSWVSNNGQAMSVNLSGELARTLPDSGTASSGGGGYGGGGPTVYHDDGLAPDVIDIELGEGKKRETSKPTPQVESSDGIVLVQFDSVNFDSSDDQKIVQEDNLTVTCSCTLSGSNASRANPVQLSWNEDGVEWLQIEPSSKPTGSFSAANKTDPKAGDLCNRCCEDHFDASAYKASASESARLTKHYSVDYKRWGNLKYRTTDHTVQANSGQDYLESCRMMRVDGYYVLMPDWQMAHLEVMTRDQLNSLANVGEYQGIVSSLLTDYAGSTTNYQTAPGDYSYTYSGKAFPQRSVTIDPAASTFTQLMSRAVYVDPIEAYPGAASSMSLTDYPFHEINNTKLADWTLWECGVVEFDPADPLNGCSQCAVKSGSASCGDSVSLTSEPIADSSPDADGLTYYSSYYSRGRLNYPATANGNYVAVVTARRSNSGLGGEGPISPYDEQTTLTRHLGITLGKVEDPDPDPDLDPDPDPDPDPNPNPGLNIGGVIYCQKADFNNGGKFRGWVDCNDADFDVSIASSDGTSCSGQPTKPSEGTPAFGCNLPSTWLDLGDSTDNEIRFSASGEAKLSPSVITEATLSTASDVNNLCVHMIYGKTTDKKGAALTLPSSPCP
ncbi:type IV pilus modification PilV family protein [Ferrimonas marina]|uniref:Prepilin-type N-terminal cleavage/methylation domain-containing protein n=1 Tax=Ferrimonas marina TaxID=299255 RepID=A0A1M5VWA9_9GAMM|nr:prepilin-type N-terminal cleavage/methylation domain-containing protein [Ferrimonas marina]SHH79562.1 prepilin-type N-terminal cleavage/methylation domain-containing protein [Ferrimonas marina]